MQPGLSVVDVFAGAGGLSLGFEQAGFSPVLGVDNDGRASAAYGANFPHARALVADIAAVHGGGLLQAAGVSECFALVGGPPCGAFSVAGRMRPDDDRRGMVAQFARLVLEAGPSFFVMENVPGILLPGARGVLDGLRRELRRGGYSLTEPWLLDAARFGVPQRRRRVFVAGCRKGLRLPQPPSPSAEPAATARQAIGDLEALDAAGGSAEPHRCALGRPSAYASVLRGDESDAADFSAARARPETLTGCGRVRHTAAVVERFDAVRPGCQERVSHFLRLHPDRPAPTLRAGTLSDRGSHTAARPIHYAFPRCITVREAARLQSMPDWFAVDQTTWRGYMQVGNAVPPLLARAVAEAILRAAA